MNLIKIKNAHKFGAPLHTAHTVADTEGVGASMLQLHTRECQ